MSKPRTSRALRNEVAARLKEALTTQKISVAEAAEELNVSRQMFYRYLKGESMPGVEVVERACKLWSLSLRVNDFTFSADAFHKEKKTSRTEHQLELFRAIAEIRPSQIETTLIRTSGDLMELRVRIKAAV